MWSLLLMVAAAAVVQSGQYGDYGAVKMPAYGDYEVPRDAPRDTPRDATRGAPRDAPLEDLPAAPISQDYKEEFDKVPQKRLSKEYGNGNWQKPSRKQYKRARHEEDYSEAQRRSRNGDRRYRDDLDRAVKDENNRDVNNRDVRARVKHKRDQHDDDDEFSVEKYIQGINENNLDVDARGRKSTEMIVRRKTRDRDFGMKDAPFKDEDFDEELRADRPKIRVPSPLKEMEGPRMGDVLPESDEFMPHSEGGRDLDVLPVEEMRRQTQEPVMPRRVGAGGGGGEGGGGGGEPPHLHPAQRARLDPGAAADTSDYEYYDLKRMQNVQKKIPGLKQRLEALEDDWELSDVDKDTRRLMNAAKHKASTQQPPRRTTATKTSKTTKTKTTKMSMIPTVVLVTTSSEPTLTPRDANSLSLAEKSRLSIMKKAGLKERDKGGMSTTKPPVLLMVTRQLPTVVLVAKTTLGDPWLRAREIHEDSPENLARVRALMRSKLVANAKNIRDLAEDWDQLICDYVDVGLLENRVGPLGLNVLVSMISCALIWFIV